MSYWQDRRAEAMARLSERRVKSIEKQLAKYYADTMERVINDFEATYNKLLNTIADDREPTPADLYKLDKYWKMQAQARAELEKLGQKQIALLSKHFEANWFEIYYSINIDGATAFTTIDKQAVQQMINQIWCADGKNWSSRIWGNTTELLDTLNGELIHIVAGGKKNSDLKKILQERFGVSYSRADALVRTEVAHIQTEAAKKRYEDCGVEEVEIWADEDERRCDVCGKLHQKRYPVGAAVPIPAHPRCRCCIIPVVETAENKTEKPKKDTPPQNALGQDIKFSEKLNTEKWKPTKELLTELSNEYDTRLTAVNVGATKAAGTVGLGGEMRLSSTSKDTTYHEFAHSISMQELTKYGVADNKSFWDEIRKVRRAYRAEVKNDTSKWISSYEHSSDNINEFMAEAFTLAKMNQRGDNIPSKYNKEALPYANSVLEIIDRYFKKPI